MQSIPAKNFFNMLKIMPAGPEAASHARQSNPTLLVRKMGVKLQTTTHSLALSFEGEEYPPMPDDQNAGSPPQPEVHVLSIPAAKQLAEYLQRAVDAYLASDSDPDENRS